ncbi:hypothetical protein BBJ28_00000528 [Nothophytophthora sp. Chile5]|nr:hypothetical protein BBJ28_00000528 [Nothophytophthora sp. Chile5]
MMARASASDAAQDVDMGGEAKQEEEESDRVAPMPAVFMTPKAQRRRQQTTDDDYEFPLTPAGRCGAVVRGLPALSGRFKPALMVCMRQWGLRTMFASVSLEEQEEYQQEHTLMPTIIQRFAELGAVIESQKRHIDRWKVASAVVDGVVQGKELDLAIEEAQQNLELIRELGAVRLAALTMGCCSLLCLYFGFGQTIQKQELQIASDQVEKQSWEEKYHLAAQEVEALKRQGTRQIQQLNSEVAVLRKAGADVEATLKERDESIETMEKDNDTLRSQLEQMEQERAKMVQEHTLLTQERTRQSEELQTLEQNITDLRRYCDTEKSKTTELEQAVASWQVKYEEKERQTTEMEEALSRGRQEMGERDGSVEQLVSENRKYQEHVETLMRQHEHQLAQQQGRIDEVEAERQRLAAELQQGTTQYHGLMKEAKEMRAQIETEAMAAMKQREQQLLGEKARVEEALNHELGRLDHANGELQAKVESLKDINRRKSTEIGRLMTNYQEAEQHQQQTADNQRIQQLTEEMEGAKRQFEKMAKELADKDTAHAEAMKTQSAEFEAQYTEFVGQVDSQFSELTQENEQLRASLEDADKKLEAQSEQVSGEMEEELSKWRAECEKLEHQLHDLDSDNEALRRELEHRVQELERNKKENADMNAQIEQFLSPNNERTKEVELLNRERLRLEEQNQELQRQIATTQTEAAVRIDEARQEHLRSVEAESAHRRAVHSLELQVTSVRSETEHWKASTQLLEKDKRGLEIKLQEVMRQATEQIEAQQQTAAVATEDGRTQLQQLTNQLLQRDSQMTEGRQQLAGLQATIRSLEEKLRSQQHQFENIQTKNEQMKIQLESLHNEKRGLENIMQQQSASSLRESQRVMEEDLSQRLERMKRDMEQRVEEEREKANRLQVVLESRLDVQQEHLNEENRKLEQTQLELQQQLEDYAGECERLDSELAVAQQERMEQDHALEEMQRTIAALEDEKWAQEHAVGSTKELETAHRDLEQTDEQFKTDVLTQLKEKSEAVSALEDDVAELQAKLDQEKEMTRHLMDRAHADKQERSEELSSKSQLVKDQKVRVEELEEMVKQLQRKIQISEESVTGKEQSLMHEKLQKEREYRSLQGRCDVLDADNAALREELDARAEEVDQLHQEVRHNTAEMDNARGHLHLSEQLSHKLEELQESLVSKEVELHHLDAELTAKEEELQQVKDIEYEEKRQLQDALQKKEDQVEALTHENGEQQAQLKRMEHARTNRVEDGESALQGLQKACDQAQQREQALAAQVARLEDEKSAMLNQFRNEMRKLNIEFGAQNVSANGKFSDDSSFHRGILEISALLRSYQDREARQDGLIHRKEKQINDLKVRVDELANSSQARDGGLKLKQRERQRLDEQEEAFQKQVDAMSQEVSKLKLENRNLRDTPTQPQNSATDSKREAHVEATREWEDKCAKLKLRVRELKEANAKLKDSRFSKADVKALVGEVEKLTSQVMEKDEQLDDLRKQERSRFKSSGSSSAGTSSRRTKDLLHALNQKEAKIMMLNDHMTELMTQNIRLQHDTERYVVQFGPLSGTAAANGGVIGNSGIRVPTRSNGSSQQPPAVRTQ